jgi:hypothetical protein
MRSNRWRDKLALHGSGASTSLSATRVRLDGDGASVEFSNGRTVSLPPAWFQQPGTHGNEHNEQASAGGLRWEVAGDDISVASLLEGLSDLSAGKDTSDHPGIHIALLSK